MLYFTSDDIPCDKDIDFAVLFNDLSTQEDSNHGQHKPNKVDAGGYEKDSCSWKRWNLILTAPSDSFGYQRMTTAGCFSSRRHPMRQILPLLFSSSSPSSRGPTVGVRLIGRNGLVLIFRQGIPRSEENDAPPQRDSDIVFISRRSWVTKYRAKEVETSFFFKF
eukprot:scaffold3238_cov91-Cylindrotheca_fusiformis.AAC.8